MKKDDSVTISIKMANKLLKLNREELINMIGFSNEFIEVINNSRNNGIDFLKSAMNVLKIKNDYGKIPFKFRIKKDYLDIINKYPNIIRKIISDDIYDNLYCDFVLGPDEIGYLDFLKYLLDRYSQNTKMQINVRHLYALGFELIHFMPNTDLDGKYSISVKMEKDKSGNDYLDINGFYSDGDKISNTIVSDGVSMIETINNNYLITYHKRKNSRVLPSIMVKNLEFDHTTLPYLGDLYDHNKLPSIDVVNKNSTNFLDKKTSDKYDEFIELLAESNENISKTEENIDKKHR